MTNEASEKERTIVNDLNEDFMGNLGSLLKKKITYWIEVFGIIVGDQARYYHYDNSDLWLFSKNVILKVMDVELDGTGRNGKLAMYQTSKITGHIELTFNDYSLRYPESYNTDSTIMLSFRVNSSDDPVEIKARYSNCQRLAEVVKLISGNIQ